MIVDESVPVEVLHAYGLQAHAVELLSGGRTNRTMRASGEQDLVLQHVRHGSHDDLLGVMENLVRVTSHLEWKRVSSDRSAPQWYPNLVPTSAGKPFIMTENGDVWRAFVYRPGLVVRRAQRADTVASIAAMYGRFTSETHDLVGGASPALLVTTQGFHDLDAVGAEYQRVVDQAPAERRDEVGAHSDRIERILAGVADRVASDGLAAVQDRVVHNDTKLSNMLLDHDQGEAVAVLDLDLVMMGPIWHDMGDLLRSACWHRPGEPGAGCDVQLFDLVTSGFMQTAGEVLSAAEIATFAAAGPRIAAELGLRYLTDHCRDEPRLRVDMPGGHLNRGLANLWLAEEMLNAYDALRPVADRLMTANRTI